MKPLFERLSIEVRIAAAVGALLLGAATWVRAFGQVRAAGVEIRKLEAELERVIAAEQDVRAAEHMLAAFADDHRNERRRSEPPSTILQRLSPELPAEFTDPEILAETPAGRLVRQEWLLDDTAAEPVFLFAAVCERQRPPWRVETIRLQAVPGRPGRVRGGIAFIGLAPPPVAR